MKKYYLIILLGLCSLAACVKREDIVNLQNQIDQIKQENIASIESQISAINKSITKLETMDGELQGYISTLEQKQSELQAKDAALEQSLKDLKVEIYSKISEEKAAVLEQLISTQQNLQQQMNDIRTKIAELEAKDKSLDEKDADLQSQINALKEELTKHEEDYSQLLKDIATLEGTLRAEITTSQNAVLSQLEAYKSEVAGNLQVINNNIAALQSKDEALQGQITSLKEYVDTELKNTKDWASATFATLEQYNNVCTTIAGIQADITSINENIAALEAKVSADKEELTNLINALDAKTAGALATAVEQFNTSISTAKEEITSAYTSAIASAISALESSLKTWVNNQLTAYYTIAQTDALLLTLETSTSTKLNAQKEYLEGLLTALQKTVDDNNKDTLEKIEAIQAQIKAVEEAISANSTAIEQLKTDLSTAKLDITAAYTKAIADAISASEGKLTGQIAEEVETINKRITDEIAAVKASIEALEARVKSCEDSIASIVNDIAGIKEDLGKVLARIQSMAVLPTYSDGSIAIEDNDYTRIAFEILPREASVALAKQDIGVFSLDAIVTETKASRFTNIPVISVEDDGECLIVTVNGSGLDGRFFAGTQALSARLKVDDGNNSRATEYFALHPVHGGKNLSLSGTANCYIVSEYGPCKFDATKKGHTAEPVGKIASAEVLWESFGNDVQPAIGDIVSNVSVKNGVVSFTASGKDGNAVIAVKDATGDILWSWHIWVCEGYDPVATAHEYYNNAGTVMDRNLGATSATKGDVKALGLMYQWGRKDPFLSASKIDFWWGVASSGHWTEAVYRDATSGTIEYAVKNPMTFIKVEQEYIDVADWLYSKDEGNNLLWNTNKGIYDPCPSGWKVPEGGSEGLWAKAFESAQDTQTNSWDAEKCGWDFVNKFSSASDWYPAVGYLWDTAGFIYQTGSVGRYWSCTRSNDSCAFVLDFFRESIHIDGNSGCAKGFSVRCVKQ